MDKSKNLEYGIEKFEKYLRETGDLAGAMDMISEAARYPDTSPKFTNRERKMLASAVEKITSTGTIEEGMSVITESIDTEKDEELTRQKRIALRALAIR